MATDGVSSRTVDLTASPQVFVYGEDTDTTSGTSTITATARNTEGTVYYRWFKNGSYLGDGVTGSSYTYTPTTNSGNMPEIIKVEINETSQTTVAALASDQISLSALKAGSDAITTVLSNDTHSIPRTAAGSDDYTGSGTTIRAWWGTIPLEIGSGAGTFTVTITDDTNITKGSLSGSNGAYVYLSLIHI